jgi:glyoxylase-like metal-dependent hydrolase (beta-lactamase superfamily II)
MIIETFESGPVATNGYLVADKRGGTAIFIDAPMGAAEAMLAKARELRALLLALINTHGHWDHIAENAWLMRTAGVPLWARREDELIRKHPEVQTRYFSSSLVIEPTQADRFLEEGDELEVGSLKFRVLHLPGHCPGHIGLFEPREQVLFSGDVLFAGSVGRADIPGADWETLLKSIHEKVLTLGDDVTVYPGHGPPTTIGQEKKTNPFL